MSIHRSVMGVLVIFGLGQMVVQVSSPANDLQPSLMTVFFQEVF